MTDSNTTTTASTQATPVKPKTVTDMESRRIFITTEDAAAYLNLCAESFTDFATTPLAAVGLKEDGSFDPAIYTDTMQVMVAVLTKQAAKGSKEGRGVKAIVVTAIPTLDAILADPAAKQWLIDKVLNKELNHVAVRPLREADDISTVVDQMPTDLAAYISTARESSGILSTFNELYKGINEVMSKAIAVWAKARLIKSDLKHALESKAYALEYYPSLENRGEGKDSLFVTALQFGINAAKAKGYDPTIFERWLETRDAKALADTAEEDEDALDIDSLTNAMMAEDAKVEPAKEAPAADPVTNEAAE